MKITTSTEILLLFKVALVVKWILSSARTQPIFLKIGMVCWNF